MKNAVTWFAFILLIIALFSSSYGLALALAVIIFLLVISL
jgi:hypothetical protein